MYCWIILLHVNLKMDINIKAKLDSLIDQPMIYKNKNLTIQKYKNVRGTNVVIFSNNRVFANLLYSEIDEFLNDLCISTNKIPIPSKKEKLDDINTLPKEKWELAQKRFAIIKPILDNPGNLKLVEKIAADEKIGRTTLYSWVRLYKDHGTISAILGKPKTGGKGKSRLLIKQEEIIKKHITSTYMASSRSSIKKTICLILEECYTKNVVAPHSNTIRNRIKNLSNEKVFKK